MAASSAKNIKLKEAYIREVKVEPTYPKPALLVIKSISMLYFAAW